MTRHRIPCALLALPLLVAAAPARAGNCRISSVASVAFTYDVFSTARQEGRGTITYDCSPPVSPTLTLSAGDSGTVAQRFMLLQGAGADQLLYNVYLDAACTQLWGTQALPGVGQHNQTQTFYACLPPLQDVSAGSYSDTLTVTVNF